MVTIVYSDGGIYGDWADPRNWSGGIVPGLTSNVQLSGGQSMTVNGPVSVNAITILNGGRDVFTGAITTAGIGASEGFIVDTNANVIFNPGSTLNDGSAAAAATGGGVFQVGVSDVGRFIANGTSAQPTTISSETGIIGKLAGGNGMVGMYGAAWTVAQSVMVGDAGIGVLDVYTGGQVNIGTSLYVGDLAGGNGSVNIGSLGVINAKTSISVGAAAWSSGVINVETGGTVNDTGNLYVGQVSGANGAINVGGQAALNVRGSLYLSYTAGAVGTGNLYSGATVTVGLNVAIGSGTVTWPSNAGELTIDAGATLDAGNRISVSGGSTLDLEGGTVSAASLIVGLTGLGTLKVDAGSQINLSGAFDMGYYTGAVGTALLSSGSTVNAAGGAFIGGGGGPTQLGTASLTIDSGASLLTEGDLTVSNGSTVNLAGGSLSGALSSGVVTIKAGGAITGWGTLATQSGGDLIDAGTITAQGGTLQIDAHELTGTGGIIIDPNSTIAITAGVLLAPTLTFMHGTGETLSLSSGADVKSIISGFGVSDQIAIAGIDSAVWSGSTDTLTLSDAGRTVGILQLAGNYANDVFSLSHVGNVGVITLHPG